MIKFRPKTVKTVNAAPNKDEKKPAVRTEPAPAVQTSEPELQPKADAN
jgi:hypothetical protein